MTMGVTVYYAEISGSKEVKKRQQRVMMILESKTIPYEAIDITEPGKETEKEFMMKNGKLRGDIKYVQSPQIFNGEKYCGDYEDFDLANENDVLEEFLNTPKIDRSSPQKNGKVENGAGSREGSSEPKVENAMETINTTTSNANEEAEPSSTPPPASEQTLPPEVSNTTTEDEIEVKQNETEAKQNDDGENAEEAEEEEEEEEKSQIDK